jgi:hypothetical protein
MSKVWTIVRRELGGSSGIDGQSFAGTEPKGVEAWLDQLAKELKDLPAAIGTEGSNLNQMAR